MFRFQEKILIEQIKNGNQSAFANFVCELERSEGRAATKLSTPLKSVKPEPKFHLNKAAGEDLEINHLFEIISARFGRGKPSFYV